MPEVTFTRKAGDSMHKFRSYSQSFMLDVSAWDGAQYPIALYHQEEGSAVSLTLHLTAAQASALAAEDAPVDRVYELAVLLYPLSKPLGDTP